MTESIEKPQLPHLDHEPIGHQHKIYIDALLQASQEL